jgi:hypothetical protein
MPRLVIPLLRLAVLGPLLLGLPTSVPGQDLGDRYETTNLEAIRILHVAADSLLARAAGEALLAMPPLPGLPGLEPRDVEVVLAGSPEDFGLATGGRAPHWSAGVAIPAAGRIVLPAWSGSELGRGNAGSLLRHEWAHLGVYRGSGGRRAPRWFTEGYAEWAGGWDRSRAWRLRLLLAAGRTPALDSLTLDWPGDRVPAESAYLLAASVLEYLVEASGERGLESLFRRWREGGSFETALRETYGVSSGRLEEDWRSWARDRYGWLFVLTHSGVAWGILALLLASTVLLRKRHNRDRMARLRARELPEAPAFWDGPGPAPPEAGGPAGERPESVGSPPDPRGPGGGIL